MLRNQKVGSLCSICKKKQSNISAFQNDEWVTADHTKLDNHADMEKADSQTKKKRCLYEGTACRRQDLGVPFQFSCHLSTPTHHLRRAQWTLEGERWAERRLPLTHPPTVRKFLGALMQRRGSDPFFMVIFFFRKETQRCARYSRVVWVEVNNKEPLRDQAFIVDSRAERGQWKCSGRWINH